VNDNSSATAAVMTSTLTETSFTGSTTQAINGTLTATSTLGNVTFSGAGAKTFNNNASTSNFVINTGSGAVTAPTTMTIHGDYANNSTFTPNSGEVILNGSTAQTATGTLNFHDLTLKNTSTYGSTTPAVSFNAALTNTGTFTMSKNTSAAFKSGATSTLQNINLQGELNGTTTQYVYLRSTATGTQWGLDVPGTQEYVTYVNVQDSNACETPTITATNSFDKGNNTCWTFADGSTPALSLEANQTFYPTQSTTTLGTITIIENTTPSIASTTDLRLTIATTTTNFRFDTTNTTPTFGGTAAGKVASTVSYIDGGATVLIDVTTNFAASDTLTISGLAVGSFATVSTNTSQLALHTDGDSLGAPAALSTNTFRIVGSLTLANHTAGQVSNQFSYANKTDQPVFAFAITPVGENATVTDMVVTLSGIKGIDSTKLSNFKLYQDNNSDKAIDGGDTLIDAAGILTINGQHGAITFSTDFLATTTTNYFVTADTTAIDNGDSLVIKLLTTSLTATGLTSNYQPIVVNTVSTIQHARINSGGGGVSAAIGGAAPAGNSLEIGGEVGGGGGVGEEVDGANIAADPNFHKPTGLGTLNEWTNGANAYDSDGVYATAATNGLRQDYTGFAFNVAGGNTIQGIAVKLDASGTTATGTIDVSISWDGGSSYTTAKATPTLSGTDIVYTVGGNTDLWGRAWTPTEFSPANFRFRVTAEPTGNTINLDALEVRVYHQAGGGSSGGGGAI
jgi:hypothetical protein